MINFGTLLLDVMHSYVLFPPSLTFFYHSIAPLRRNLAPLPQGWEIQMTSLATDYPRQQTKEQI